MLFHSQVFVLGFLPVVLFGYYALAASRTARQLWLVAASLVFYAWWDVRYVLLLAGLAVATWLVARSYLGRPRPWLIAAGVALNLGALAVFKYADFLGGSAAALVGASWVPLAIVLPLGISFFVFQKVSYLVDLRRGDRHAYGFLDFALFVSFFPQLIAGPLVRHNEIIPQFALDPRRPAMWENVSRGAVLFLIGMAKKLAVADTLAPGVDALFRGAALGPVGAASSWIAAAGYALQIYFDFSGYSDMAIGLARMFGLTLPLNFDAPYRAVSIRDFWRRWHITLSRFLRDYLYIPLGGNRRGAARQAANVVATMLLGGLWHGAAWNFVLWGGLHGAALAANGAWNRLGLPRLPRPVGWLLTLLFVVVAWVPFRAPDFATGLRLLRGLAGLDGLGAVRFENAYILPVAAAVALVGPTSQAVAGTRLRPSPWVAIPAGAALAGLLLLAGGRLHDAFIYFQF